MEKFRNIEDVEAVSAFPGHFRRTLTGNSQVMMCLFNMKAGTRVELHNHPAAQIGYILEGEMEFFDGKGNTMKGGQGFSYVFDSDEMHGCAAVTDCEFIECFSPARPEYDN